MEEAIERRIVKLIADLYKETGKAITLSRIPILLDRDGVSIRSVIGERKLKEFLAAELADKIRLIQNPLDPLVWGALPGDVEVDEGEIAALFSKPEQKSPRDIRFKPSVWAAFTKPLIPGSRRFLNVGSKVFFFDGPENLLPPGNWIEIGSDSIFVGENEEDKHRIVPESILKWVGKNRIPIGVVSEGQFHSIHESDIKSWMMRLLDLPDRDLERILIPLDIVRKSFRI